MTTTTRKWIHGLLSTAINGFASGIVLMVVDPTNFNIADWRKLLITSGLLGLIGMANYLKSSPLPSIDDVKSLAVALLLAPALAFSTGCATRPAPNATPAQVEQTRLRELARVATVSERVGKLVESLQTTEIAFHQIGKVSREDHRVVQTLMKVTADTVVDALERMKDLAQTEAARRQWIAIARGAVDRLINEGIVPIVDPDARIELRLIASAVSSILVTLELMADAGPPGQWPRIVAAEPFTLEASWAA